MPCTGRRFSRELVACALLFIVSAIDARAQVKAGVAVGGSKQAAGASDLPYLGPPFGGTSIAMLAMVDVPLGSRASVGGEASLAGTISGAQIERVPGGGNTVVSDHHDNVFSGVLKLGTPPGDRVRAAAVIGGGIAHRDTERNGTFGSSFPPIVSTPVHEALSDWVPALTGGVDLAVGLNNHVAVLAAGRLHQLKDDDRLPDGVVHRGVSSTIFRFGVGAQVRF